MYIANRWQNQRPFCRTNPLLLIEYLIFFSSFLLWQTFISVTWQNVWQTLEYDYDNEYIFNKIRILKGGGMGGLTNKKLGLLVKCTKRGLSMPQPNVKAEGKVQPPAPGAGQAVDELFQKTEGPRFELEDEEPPEPGQGLEIPGGEVVEEPAPEGQAALQALLKKKGLKSADDLVKSYENLERQFQEKSRVAAKAAAIPPPLPDFNAVAEGIRQRPRRPVPDIKVPDDPLELFKDKTAFTNFLGDYQKAVEARTTNAVEVQQELERAQQLYVESRQLAEEFPEDFQRLRPIMADLVNYYPNASPRQLFEIAKSQAEKQKQEAMDIVRRELGFDGVDLGRLKSLLGRANPVPLAEGGAPPIGSTEGMTTRQIREDTIKKAILASDQLY